MPDVLTLHASAQPGKLAVIDDRPGGNVVSWTYARLEAEANRLANVLASLGVGPGEKVIWCGPNSPQVVAVINAARKLGAVAVPLNYRLTAAEARYIVTHSDASAACVDAEYAHLIPAPRDEGAGHLRHDRRLQRLRRVPALPCRHRLLDDGVRGAYIDPARRLQRRGYVRRGDGHNLRIVHVQLRHRDVPGRVLDGRGVCAREYLPVRAVQMTRFQLTDANNCMCQ